MPPVTNMVQHLKKVLVANRGEIAVRCIRACKDLSITSVTIFTPADANSLHVRLSDESVLLEDEGPGAYTDIDAILDICKKHAIDAVIPGYGFLSENTEFSRRVEEAGMVFVGPDANAINAMGLKHTSRDLAIKAGVPVVPGSRLLNGPDDALKVGREMGFPVIMKASGGGGGMGQQTVLNESEVKSAFASVESRSKQLFKDAGVYMEKYFPKCHHIEVQVFGNGKEVIHFGERECSIQRRHQKVIEECPAPYIQSKPELRERLTSCAVALTELINYRSAGTVEFLVDDQTGDFFFLEMNTRLQVEHGITELCYDVDLVVLMLRQADYQIAGKGGIPAEEMAELQKKGNTLRGAAIEARVCCENAADRFLPTSGVIQELKWPEAGEARVDTWVQAGTAISSYFDSLLAKVMVHASTREEAIKAMQNALGKARIGGVTTTLEFLASIISSEPFKGGRTLTTFLDDQFSFRPIGVKVVEPGAFTTVQQPRPRNMKGYGVPPSGPLDDLSAIIGNLLVGNPRDTECLEVTMSGPELYFYSAAVVAIAGASFSAKLNGQPVDMWSSILIKPRDTLTVGTATGAGARCYIAIKGGLPGVPEWLGSKSTTPNLVLGGLQGRRLAGQEHLELEFYDYENANYVQRALPPALIPPTSPDTIYVMHGPHDSDEFITAAGRRTIYTNSWKIDHNCSRTGIRLVGPRIEWARKNGAEAAGSHPSNVVDYPYPSPGGVNWTGDSPVFFPHDAPGLGGFLCSSTVPTAELWKLGQLKPGAEVTLTPVSYQLARELASKKEQLIKAVEEYTAFGTLPGKAGFSLDVEATESSVSDAILEKLPGDDSKPSLTLRQAGDNFILVNIGFEEVGLHTAINAELLARAVRSLAADGIFVHVNISSIMVEYDTGKLDQPTVVSRIRAAHAQQRGAVEPVPCRRLELPIVFDHPSIRESEERYMKLQRENAVYMPDEVQYMQENNGLGSRDAVFDILRRTRFLVVTVGFMSGLPLMLPLDPLSRLTCQKYNPTRTTTPPGTVGLGGSLFCIYPTEQPGGYMMLARSLPVWDTFCVRPSFAAAGTPWLCEPFDLVEFREVGVAEYEDALRRFESGTYRVEFEAATFDVGAELAAERERAATPAVAEFRRRQRDASRRMLAREEARLAEWDAAQQAALGTQVSEADLGAGAAGESRLVASQIGKIWKVQVAVGDRVVAGQTLLILEAMKMEIPVAAGRDHDGLVVKDILLREGALVSPGNVLMVLE